MCLVNQLLGCTGILTTGMYVYSTEKLMDSNWPYSVNCLYVLRQQADCAYVVLFNTMAFGTLQANCMHMFCLCDLFRVRMFIV